MFFLLVCCVILFLLFESREFATRQPTKLPRLRSNPRTVCHWCLPSLVRQVFEMLLKIWSLAKKKKVPSHKSYLLVSLESSFLCLIDINTCKFYLLSYFLKFLLMDKVILILRVPLRLVHLSIFFRDITFTIFLQYFTTNHEWLVVISSNLNLTLKLFFLSQQ